MRGMKGVNASLLLMLKVLYPFCVMYRNCVGSQGKSCRRVVAAVAAVGVIWKFRSTFRPGNYIWSLSLWIWTQMRHLGTLIPRFCTEFRYESNGQSGLAWGAIFEKVTKYLRAHAPGPPPCLSHWNGGARDIQL